MYAARIRIIDSRDVAVLPIPFNDATCNDY